jgi:hypothetical protein
MLSKWGEKIGRNQIRKSLSEMESEHMDLSKHPPREVWVLYILDDVGIFDTVQDLLERLREERGVERTRAFALLPEDEVPDRATGARDMEYIRSKDLSWTSKLKWDPLQSSDQGGPDIIIDLTDGRSVAMDRLMSEVPAGLRIGRYSNERMPFYDLMVETQEDEGIGDLCDRVLRYLELMMEKKN